ncbi:dihydroorotase family protein [Patescibacteria group bacterium]
MKKILIKNGRLIDPAKKTDKMLDIFIENHKIKRIAKGINADDDTIVINAKNKIVSPGFIDIHVHLREPGREDKETIHTASRAAAKGGITSIVGMPNTNPVADDQTVIEYVLSKAKKESLVNVFVSGSITKGQEGQKIAEIWELQKTGAIAVSDDGFDVQNADVYRKAMQYCKTYGMPIISHTEDRDLAKDGQMHEGKISSKLGLKGIPACCEDIATAKIICLVEDTGHKVHFTHVSSSGAIDLICLAKKKGLKITGDTTPNHFSLTDEAVENHNTYAKVNPPLRSEAHRKALLKALKDGTLSVIVTDHAPHLWTEKERPFDEAPCGIVGFETMLPLIITNLVDKKVLSISKALEKITINPAKVLNLKKGTLSKGADADITIFDPKAKVKIDRTKFESKGQNSPYHGQTLKGVVTETIVNGEIVVQNSEIIS